MTLRDLPGAHGVNCPEVIYGKQTMLMREEMHT